MNLMLGTVYIIIMTSVINFQRKHNILPGNSCIIAQPSYRESFVGYLSTAEAITMVSLNQVKTAPKSLII